MAITKPSDLGFAEADLLAMPLAMLKAQHKSAPASWKAYFAYLVEQKNALADVEAEATLEKAKLVLEQAQRNELFPIGGQLLPFAMVAMIAKSDLVAYGNNSEYNNLAQFPEMASIVGQAKACLAEVSLALKATGSEVKFYDTLAVNHAGKRSPNNGLRLFVENILKTN